MRSIILICIMCCIYFTTFSAVDHFKNYRLRWNYIHNHYDRVIKLSRKILISQPKNPSVNYCYAISLFQVNKLKWRGVLVDQVLKHLKLGLDTTKEKVEFIKSDTTVLRDIKEKALKLTLSEFAKYPSKSLTRVQTIVAIYGDSAEVYKVFEIERDRINKKMIAAAISTKKTEDKPTLETNLIYTIEKSTKKDLFDTIERYCGMSLSDEQKALLKTAFSYDNVASCSSGTNPDVMQFFHQVGFKNIANDEVNWCAAFVNFCMEKQGYGHPKTLLARSWLKMGIPVKDPKPGDLVVFWRGKLTGWQGHVGFFIREDKERNLIYVYGGNQGGAVCLKPFAKSQILGFRRVIPD
jgi:uncharacterized protein (TIGR02594 family)